eukprot:20590-Pyramimonas_sp.AAC.1
MLELPGSSDIHGSSPGRCNTSKLPASGRHLGVLAQPAQTLAEPEGAVRVAYQVSASGGRTR